MFLVAANSFFHTGVSAALSPNPLARFHGQFQVVEAREKGRKERGGKTPPKEICGYELALVKRLVLLMYLVPYCLLVWNHGR